MFSYVGEIWFCSTFEIVDGASPQRPESSCSVRPASLRRWRMRAPKPSSCRRLRGLFDPAAVLTTMPHISYWKKCFRHVIVALNGASMLRRVEGVENAHVVCSRHCGREPGAERGMGREGRRHPERRLQQRSHDDGQLQG